MIQQKLQGRYEILFQIGEGGTSKIYLAKDLKLNKFWAVKIIDKQKSGGLVSNARSEIDFLMKLNSPNILRIVDFFEDDNYAYLIEDYIDGQPLADFLKQDNVTQELALDWCEQILHALIYLHSLNIVYRDLKPENLVLSPRGEITMIDFGAARTYDADKKTNTVNLGTVGYAAPEQYLNDAQTDFRADIYAFGVFLFQLLTGAAHIGKDPQIKKALPKSKISPALKKIILKCIEEKPENRYQDAHELLFEIKRAGSVGAFEKRARRRSIRVVAMYAILSVAFFTASLLFHNLDRARLDDLYNSYINYAQNANYTEIYSAYQNAHLLKPQEMLPIYLQLKLKFERNHYTDGLIADNSLFYFNAIDDTVKKGNPLLAAHINYFFAYLYTDIIGFGDDSSYQNAPADAPSAYKFFSKARDYFLAAGVNSNCADFSGGKSVGYPFTAELNHNAYCISNSAAISFDYYHQLQSGDSNFTLNIPPEQILQAFNISATCWLADIYTEEELYNKATGQYGIFEALEHFKRAHPSVDTTEVQQNLRDAFKHLLSLNIALDSRTHEYYMEQYRKELLGD
jgi:serine/threonine protein kinase